MPENLFRSILSGKVMAHWVFEINRHAGLRLGAIRLVFMLFLY